MSVWLTVRSWFSRLRIPIGVADVLFVAGVGAIFYGCYQIWRPLAWLILGMILGALGLFMVLRERRSP